ncbi:MAG: hypothetical protein Q4D91_12260 [Lautropia sp.]|nr:hypothetical protein [Lautropia sp.]
MSRHDDAPAAQTGPFEGFGPMFDSLEHFNQAWRTLHMHSPFKPTLDIQALDKRIQELRTVEQWLSLNLTMLRNTIQAMEVQRGTLQTLNQMSASLAAMTRSPDESTAPLGTGTESPPNPLASLWPGMAAWTGMAGSPDSRNAQPPNALGGSAGMNAFPGMPSLSGFDPFAGGQPFGHMPWMPNLGQMPDMSTLFGGPAHEASTAENTATEAAHDERTAATQPRPAPSDSATTSTPAASAPVGVSESPGTPLAGPEAAPRPYTPPGWAAATGTDGWKAAVSSPRADAAGPAAAEDSTATLAASQLAQAWWQLMQQQVSQMAAQAAPTAGAPPHPDHPDNTASSAPVTPGKTASAPRSPDKVSAPSTSRRKKNAPPDQQAG